MVLATMVMGVVVSMVVDIDWIFGFEMDFCGNLVNIGRPFSFLEKTLLTNSLGSISTKDALLVATNHQTFLELICEFSTRSRGVGGGEKPRM